MPITNYLNSAGVQPVEGYSQQIPQQVEDLIQLIKNPNMKNCMEIGFNAGHSAELFLQNNNNITLTSFDLGVHNYVKTAKKYIDVHYPNRHTLILGDSRETVSNYIKSNDVKFDIIFIDGGHDYEISDADMKNCFHLSHKDTIVIMDDTIFTNSLVRHWNVGPTRTWNEHLEQHKVVEFERKEYSEGRGMVWGKYVFHNSTTVTDAQQCLSLGDSVNN